ncbi:MAG: TetR/AcrR family transcriptional regulator [Clostridia bacterium]|nr:TetR/AcrR family transcriptional regulator [Clostridia bacterium]
MATKTDARIIKTKARLYDAFFALLHEKLFEEITINEICTRAVVRRATFYKHFSDKYDFLADMTESIVKNIDAKIQGESHSGYPIEYHIEYVHRLIDYLICEHDAVALLLKSAQMPMLVSTIAGVNYEVLEERLTMSVAGGEMLVASVRTVATMLAGGIGTMIASWLEGGMAIPKEELLLEIEKVIRAVFVK